MKRSFARSRAARRGLGAFTLIELAIATSILMIGIVSVLSASSRMHSLRRANRERTLAQNAVRSTAERLHAAAHALSADPVGWVDRMQAAYGPSGTPGALFDVTGLDAVDEGERVGSIAICSDETRTDQALGADLGMPRDLNGDGDANDLDVTDDARLLPVVITLRWRGDSGVHVMRHGFFLTGF